MLSFDEAKQALGSLTPMMQQYLAVKNKHPDCIVFFRLGDFFELFFDDAVLASGLLEIVLTKRGSIDGAEIPMCGIPAHSYEFYLSKLIKNNLSVAICDQMETPDEAKKLRGTKAVVERRVTRIVTPATVLEENLLNSNSKNYLCAIVVATKQISLAYLDISTQDFSYASFKNFDELKNHLNLISPKEILIADDVLKAQEVNFYLKTVGAKISNFHSSFFNEKTCTNKIQNFFEIKSTLGFGDLNSAEISCIGAIIGYLEITLLENAIKPNFPKKFNESDFLSIDIASKNALELFVSSKGDSKNSLFHILNTTITSLGNRLMVEFMNFPLTNINKIEARLKATAFFVENFDLTLNLRDILGKVSDLERILSRIITKKAYSNDIIALKTTLHQILPISEKLYFLELPDLMKQILLNLGTYDEVLNLLNKAIDDSPLSKITNGGVIKKGFDAKLDEYRNLENGGENVKQELLEKYKTITGVQNLKIKENNIVGLFLETSSQNFERISVNNLFIHRQTLPNFVRFTTSELKELETKIVNARNYSQKLETELFFDILEKIAKYSSNLQTTAKAFALLDVILSFAYNANKQNLTKPILDSSNEIIIEEARHLVVEKNLKVGALTDFIANDLRLTFKENIWLITGPNMAGKSTFLRQNAIIILMAQMGSFVPAKMAKIGLVDKLFTRIGAYDDLSSNQSTFMVEMIEAANILNNATKNSFVILDEIGRGTATVDGLSIAFSILEYLHNKIGSRCLFATHYHELIDMVKPFKNLGFYTVLVKEWQNEVVFMHKIIKGVAEKSYGIFVAKIAGLPKPVIERAKQILTTLNSQKLESLDLFNLPSKHQEDNPYKHFTEDLAEKLKYLDDLSPKQALELLYAIKDKVKSLY